jgi:hypothetical protein
MWKLACRFVVLLQFIYVPFCINRWLNQVINWGFETWLMKNCYYGENLTKALKKVEILEFCVNLDLVFIFLIGHRWLYTKFQSKNLKNKVEILEFLMHFKKWYFYTLFQGWPRNLFLLLKLGSKLNDFSYILGVFRYSGPIMAQNSIFLTNFLNLAHKFIWAGHLCFTPYNSDTFWQDFKFSLL